LDGLGQVGFQCFLVLRLAELLDLLVNCFETADQKIVSQGSLYRPGEPAAQYLQRQELLLLVGDMPRAAKRQDRSGLRGRTEMRHAGSGPLLGFAPDREVLGFLSARRTASLVRRRAR